MEKRAKPPPGAEVLYRRLLGCDPKDGLVVLEFGSGAHAEHITMPLKVAMQLHHRLGDVIDKLLQGNVTRLTDVARADH
jgi:hypothetical protein